MSIWCKIAHRRHWWERIPGFLKVCDKCGQQWRDMNGPMVNQRMGSTLIPVYVINLKESAERREHMKREMVDARIPFTFVEALSGKEINETKGTASRNQTACALSHLHAIRLIAEGSSEFGAVFEDDVIVMQHARQFLYLETLCALPSFDVMQFFNSATRAAMTVKIAEISKHEIRSRSRPFITMVATVYHRSAARHIVRDITEIDAPIDELLFSRTRSFGLRVVSVSPGVVSHGDFPSDVATPGPKVRNKPLREIHRAANCVRRAASFAAAWGC